MNDTSDILKEAIKNHQTGNLQKAEQFYRLNPEHSLALHSLGIVAHQNGQNDIAMDMIAEAIASDPQNHQFYNTQGLVFEAVGKIDEAICSYQKAITIKPDYAEAYLNLAIAFQAIGNFDKAVEKCNQIILLFGGSGQVYNLMGYSLQQQGYFSEAVASYRQAIHLEPDFAEPYNHIGVIFIEQNQYDQAVENCRKALELAPDYVEAYCNLGTALNSLALYGEAVENYQKAINLDPEYTDAYYNLGNCLRNQNQCECAIQIYKRAIQIKPDCAKAHWNLAISYLLTGRFSEGWNEYQWRRNPEAGIIVYPHHYDQPYWDGSLFAGKRLLVHYEQGFGDNIQFIRYLPMVKNLGGTVILEVQRPLYELFKQIEGVDEFVQSSLDGKAPDVNFDFHISTLDMPRLFGTTLENIPCNVPYLHVESAKAEYWRNRLGSEPFKIGLVWSGSAKHGNDHNRSCPLKHFAPLAKIEGVKLYGLQKEAISSQLSEMADDMKVICLGEEFEDFTDTAAAIENMDLVVSVDTSVLHLAGAMGKAVWAIIPFGPDWRWMLDREDSPWYPTMKLFRQKEPGNWHELFVRVTEQLKMLLSRNR